MVVDGRIRLEVEGSSGPLNERQGFSLALALNELITNALQHAFPNGRHGTVRITVEDLDGHVQIEVSDDGIGLDASPTGEITGSGQSIVDALVRGDLNGRVEYLGTDCGTCVRLSFPRDPSSSR